MNLALATDWMRAKFLAVGVLRQDRELRLRVPERHFLALERHPLCQQSILELILTLGELRRDEARLAGLAQPVEQLSIVPARLALGLLQRVELLAAEEVGEPADDLCLLGDFLLADANRAPFLRALEKVALESRLELRGAQN